MPHIASTKTFLFILWFFLISPVFYCQINFIPEKYIPVEADFFSVDNLGNIYTVKSDLVRKFSERNEDGEWRPVNTYSNKLPGKISSLDVTNPMKLLLFYKNLSQVIFLDNTLSAQADPLILQDLGLEQASLACSSINNGLWIYDQRNFQLLRLDQNLQKISETGNILQQTGGELRPIMLIEKNNWLYLNDTARGILVFDVYGTYSKTIPVKNIRNFQIIEDALFFERSIGHDNEEIEFFSFSLKTMEQKKIPMPESEFKQVFTNGKKLFILVEDGIKIYTESVRKK